ncbi:hypothetical protein [Burkholderia phage FLC9]|nr:hypothetical protein [Burkholderia phage FLC9]
MTKKIKHPQHILVIDKEFTDELPGMALKHGVTRFNQSQYDYWLEHSVSHLMTGQREKMEFDPRFRQILPYTPVVFSDTPENIDWANSPIFLYQRTKQVGEERLGGNYSIGGGGHVDHADVHAHESIVNFKHTITTNLVREVANEEFEFKDGEKIVSPTDIPETWQERAFEFVPYGLIRDDSNNVGKVHLGVVNVIVVPTRFKVRCKEAELITCEPMTATQLKASGLKFEGWTQILIDSFLDVPCSVEPKPRRDVQYDMLAAQYFTHSVEGDKWTELAIEFNTTVATLYRLNLAHFDDNELDVGTRVIVPDQPDELVKVETPQQLIEALNNDTERARAKAQEIVGKAPSEEGQAQMTSMVLRGILDQGPDYENCGLRFLVTQDMANRLMLLDPAIAHLIEHGIVVIVPEENLPNVEAITIDPASAEQVKEGRVNWLDKDGELIKGAPNPLPGLEYQGNEGKEAVDHSAEGRAGLTAMPNPTDDDLNSPLFEAIWQVIKKWDVNVPEFYAGYCGANGSHAKLILDSILAKGTSGPLYVKEVGGIVVNGDLALSDDAQVDVEAGFHRAVKLGEENNTARHVLENGDSFVSICEKYNISLEDFERWNGFQGGHAWPTHTGYVFVADPAITQAEEPTL